MAAVAFTFRKATKSQARLRLALLGPSGSGKTYTALSLACALSDRVAVIDTERGSAAKYADVFAFDVLELTSFAPDTYVAAILAATKAGYGAIVVDSLSHAWMGRDGALEQVDRAAKKSQSGNNFLAWRDVTPMHNRLVDALVSAPAHIIGTMRVKTEYVIEENGRGKMAPRKVGMAPVQRDGLEYEFDVVADMNLENELIVSKTRCSALTGRVFPKPGKDVADILRAWLSDGPPAADPETGELPHTAGNGFEGQIRRDAALVAKEVYGHPPTIPAPPPVMAPAANVAYAPGWLLDKYLDAIHAVTSVDDLRLVGEEIAEDAKGGKIPPVDVARLREVAKNRKAKLLEDAADPNEPWDDAREPSP